MRLATYVWTVVCAMISVAAAAKPVDLSTKVNSDGIVVATDALLENVFSRPRDYTVALLLTAEGTMFDCGFCRVIGPNYRQLARSWLKQTQNAAPDSKIYFVVADVEGSRRSFEKLGLQSVPNLAFYPPTESAQEVNRGLQSKHQFIAFQSIGDQTDYLLNVFAKQGFPIKIVKPFPWDLAIKAAGTAVGVLTAAIVFRNIVIKVLTAKKLWLALCMVAILLFTAGHMFNITRRTPLMGNDHGRPVLFEPSFQSQYAIETQIVAVIYALLSFATIGLISHVPRLDSSAQAAGAVGGALAVLAVYSVLIEVFKIKFQGYPQSLLPIALF